jgi:hypothetical protein
MLTNMFSYYLVIYDLVNYFIFDKIFSYFLFHFVVVYILQKQSQVHCTSKETFKCATLGMFFDAKHIIIKNNTSILLIFSAYFDSVLKKVLILSTSFKFFRYDYILESL